MQRVITLLNEKNHYLEKFYALNESELVFMKSRNFDNLDSFYETRERILEMLRYLDSELGLSQQESEPADLSPIDKKIIVEALRVKTEYVNRILAQDLEVLSCIEAEKNFIIRELQEVKKVKTAVSKYKMPMFDSKLDEEA
ncbi:MAG: hypothetical protein AB7O96_06600 [Pseudobdellovibrionaceae bacterium]